MRRFLFFIFFILNITVAAATSTEDKKYEDEVSKLSDINFAKSIIKNGSDFIGPDVTQDSLVAGGMLCGKKYADIADQLLEKYDYRPVAGIEKYGE